MMQLLSSNPMNIIKHLIKNAFSSLLSFRDAQLKSKTELIVKDLYQFPCSKLILLKKHRKRSLYSELEENC